MTDYLSLGECVVFLVASSTQNMNGCPFKTSCNGPDARLHITRLPRNLVHLAAFVVRKRERRRRQASILQQVPTSPPRFQMLLSKSRLKQPSSNYQDRAAYFWSSAGLLQLLRERTTLTCCCIALLFCQQNAGAPSLVMNSNEVSLKYTTVHRWGQLIKCRARSSHPLLKFGQTHYSQPLLAPRVWIKDNKIRKP